jgi:hypothetical protein
MSPPKGRRIYRRCRDRRGIQIDSVLYVCTIHTIHTAWLCWRCHILSPNVTEKVYPKDFTHSERVAIGEAIERELAGRHGVRHDTMTDVENFPPLEGKTRDLAAKAAGFGNGKHTTGATLCRCRAP